MTKKEARVIKAFLNCIYRHEYTVDYAITVIENNEMYGWLSDEAKEYFYEELEKRIMIWEDTIHTQALMPVVNGKFVEGE